MLRGVEEQLDLIEIAVYGDVKRSIQGPFSFLGSSSLLCKCFSDRDNKLETKDCRTLFS